MKPRQRITAIVPPICPEETPITVSNTINPQRLLQSKEQPKARYPYEGHPFWTYYSAWMIKTGEALLHGIE
jgi:hypothetical protein